MKKLPYFIVAILILLTACATPAAPDASGQPDSSASVQTVSLAGGQGDEEPAYYGTFRLSSCVFAPISGMSMEEARGYLGSQVTYAPDSAASSLGECCDAPVYQEQTVTAEDFSGEYNGVLSLEDVNLSGGQVTAVTLADTGMFGCFFYVRGADSLVIPLDGAFFLAQRVQP